ncbi:signal-regulatory protein beta-1-like [Clarias gariepinus]|uniref:signal-regulatory protein beta-1-like n=1 Tax=Clarias gariepinus TaxID=13013 RepID=UPI00234C47AC|nr:signal-regulatory protein beta-1-like [Clarias gariepinus]
MTGFWILILILSIMYIAQPSRRWVTAQLLTESPVSQPDRELSVDIGDSATLQCCVSEKVFGMIAWFKQLNRKQPEMIVKLFKNVGDTFDIDFQNPRFQTKKHSNCFNIIISQINKSDEAMYYCALMRPDIVFADGTHLKIKGEHVTTPETSNSPLYDNSVVCEPSPHTNTTNMNTHEKTVNQSMGHSPKTKQQSGAETLNYAALHFTKRKDIAEKRKTDTECVYSAVNETVKKENNL